MNHSEFSSPNVKLSLNSALPREFHAQCGNFTLLQDHNLLNPLFFQEKWHGMADAEISAWLNKSGRRADGFTLVEMLVVIVTIYQVIPS